MSAVTARVMMPHTPAFGMSLVGSCDSSAASGSSSMPRKNQIAKGRANRMPMPPNGRNSVLPSVGAMSNSLAKSTEPVANAAIAKKAITPIEMIATTSAKRKPIDAPSELRPMNRTYRIAHQTGAGSEMPVRVESAESA